jgi:type I restriction enzyme M protein
MTRITQQNLESYLWGAAVLLRGTIDAGDYKQFIFPLLFFKRLCDVFDEETVTALRESGGDQDFALFPENHRFQIPSDAHWREIRKVSRDVGRGLQQAMRAIETANPDKLFGIFGDAQWTNKDRLSDAMLRDLIEHFSTLELTVDNLPEDELGQGYEYLIKKFADDSGHTAAEFYTNRTVVHLMTEMLDVQPGESVYDPTCGSGGMLLSCIAHLRNQKKEWRNVKLYGQERNLMTSSIARMNCFLHGIEDFRIERGDTLAEPKLVEGDRLQRFDVVLANPPYSIKQWNREAFAADPWGRNVFGVPPQGRADYAFQQHILQSLKPKTGRCAVLWPHGVLFRQEEGGNAPQAHRSRPHRVRPRPRPEPLLQLADGSLRRRLPHAEAQSAARKNPLHQRGERSHPRTRPELPHRRAPPASRPRLSGVQRRARLHPRRAY